MYENPQMEKHLYERLEWSLSKENGKKEVEYNFDGERSRGFDDHRGGFGREYVGMLDLNMR